MEITSWLRSMLKKLPTEFNGCLYFIPGSQKVGDLEPHFDEATAYKFWGVPKEDLLDIMARSPEPVPITGDPSTVVFFHPNILHASGPNLSRHDRWAIYVVCNRVANRPLDVPNPRPDYVRSANFATLKLGSDAILSAGMVAA
jgi:ectoine hydroxylase